MVPRGHGAPPRETTCDRSDDLQREARMAKARRFGYRAIAVMTLLTLAELVYLLVA